jgi:hypothetical protein
MSAWDDLPAGHSPFKVMCSAHGGTQLVERGGAFGGADGFVSVAWKPRAGRPVPQSGDGAANEGGGRTYTLECPKCRLPKEIRHGNLVRLLKERAAAGDVDHKGRVCLDLAELGF